MRSVDRNNNWMFTTFTYTCMYVLLSIQAFQKYIHIFSLHLFKIYDTDLYSLHMRLNKRVF